MGGGGGKGGGGDNKAGKDLSKIAKSFYKDTGPVRGELIDQFLEALTTGGVGARMPIISKAQEASQQATSNTMRDLDAQLAQSGLAGTPFGENIRSQSLMSGNQRTAAIPTNIVSQLLQQIPGFVTGANQTTVSGLGQAASAESQSQAMGPAWLSSIMSPFSFSKQF